MKGVIYGFDDGPISSFIVDGNGFRNGIDDGFEVGEECFNDGIWVGFSIVAWILIDFIKIMHTVGGYIR